ncbi:hypothetical protein FRC07_002667, partial [Ceratobasidium sp. 392]
IQATQHASNAPLPLTEVDDIENAPKKCKTWRSTLTSAVQGYLAACTDLAAACTSSHHPYRQRDFEATLLTIDAEFTSIALEEATLDKAWWSLAVARNQSATITPIHSLPVEILTNIFLMVQYGFENVSNSKQIPPAQVLAGTSSYWRKIATGTPALWTEIKITTEQIRYDYAALCLHRANTVPIYLTVLQTSSESTDEFWAREEVDNLHLGFSLKHVHGFVRLMYTLGYLPTSQRMLH